MQTQLAEVQTTMNIQSKPLNKQTWNT